MNFCIVGAVVAAEAMGGEVVVTAGHTCHTSSCTPLLAMESVVYCIGGFIFVGRGGGS